MSGIELVAGVVAAFFAFGIAAGVLGVTALSAVRSHRENEDRRRRAGRYDLDQTAVIDWTSHQGPRRPGGPDWEDRPGWEEPPGADHRNDLPPPWPGRRG